MTDQAVLESQPASQEVAGNRSILSVDVGRHSFAIDTRHVEAFFDISRNRAQIDRVLEESGMDSQVQSLTDRIGPCLSGEWRSDEREKALISIRKGDFSGGLRVESVSRPVEVAKDRFHTLPRIARCPNFEEIFHGVVVGQLSDTAEPDDASHLTFVIDPLATLGQASEEEQPTLAVGGSRPADQVLVFLPQTGAEVQELDYLFCLLITDVAEVISTNEFVPLPYQTPHCEGFILWRNEPVPVVRMAKLFGMEQQEVSDRRERKRNRRLIVARAGGRWIAFCVNTQMQTLRSPTATVSANKRLPENAPIVGSFRTEMGDLIVPDLNRILDNEF